MNDRLLPQADLGHRNVFLSYVDLNGFMADHPGRRIRHACKGTYTLATIVHTRALMMGVGESSASAICRELKSNGYIGLVDIEVKHLGNREYQIRGRPVVRNN